MKTYAVIDDFGDDWEEGRIVHEADTLDRVYEWAEENNFHSASIVSIEDDIREIVR